MNRKIYGKILNLKNIISINKIVIGICVVLAVCFVAPPTVFAYEGVDYAEIDKQLEQDVEDYNIPGMAVVVVNSDEVLFSETYGNCESINTPFIIGSMSKSFTALSIMQLVEQGRINLDAPISEYIDCSLYLKYPEEGDKISVRQLLNQTSGLGAYQKFGTAKITNSYGKYVYANVNYSLLGEIIESVSGESYSAYVEQYIFAPLGMDKTSATLEESKEDGLIPGYRNFFGIPIQGEPDYPDENSWSLVPAGYISSSAEDMGNYLQMYLKGGEGIISQDGINTMFYNNILQDESGQNYYGMGWQISYGLFSEPVINHSGLVENYTSNMFIFPESDVAIVVLVNMNDYLVNNNMLGNIVRPLLGGEKQDMSANTYWLYHGLIDAFYLLIIMIAVWPLLFIKKWKKKPHGKKTIALDIVRHMILPMILIMFPYILGFPLWVVYYYVKDLFMVLIISSVILVGTGIYKVIWRKIVRTSDE